MNGSSFILHPSSFGLDTIEFQFSPNLGEPAKPLRAIASSGEMARVMLALKTVLATEDEIPVLIFDEVDSGIGGRVAEIVGQLLKQLGKDVSLLVDAGAGHGIADPRTREEATALARTMLGIGKGMGKKVAALITDMDQPLGRRVGNALEVRQAVEILRGDRRLGQPAQQVGTQPRQQVADLVERRVHGRDPKAAARLRRSISRSSSNGCPRRARKVPCVAAIISA